MKHKKLSPKQQKIAAEPRDQITGADFKALRGRKSKKQGGTMASAMGYQRKKPNPQGV